MDSKTLGKRWLAACAISSGDLLKTHDGRWVPVESVSDTDEDVTVYNMRIAEYHTYFVGDTHWGFSVWAHNATYRSNSGMFEKMRRGNNSAANAKVSHIAKSEGLTLDQMEQLHEAITGQNLSPDEIRKIAKEIAGR